MPCLSIVSRAKSSSAWASSEKCSTKGTAASIAATSAPERRATSATRPKVVNVLVGEDHQLDLGEGVTQPCDPALELVQRRAGVRPRVHERERSVLDQVDVHSPHCKWRGDGDALQAGFRRGDEGIVDVGWLTSAWHARTVAGEIL